VDFWAHATHAIDKTTHAVDAESDVVARCQLRLVDASVIEISPVGGREILDQCVALSVDPHTRVLSRDLGIVEHNLIPHRLSPDAQALRAYGECQSFNRSRLAAEVRRLNRPRRSVR